MAVCAMLVKTVLSTRPYNCACEEVECSKTADVAVVGKIKAGAGGAKATGDGQGEAKRLNHDL